MQSLLDNLVVRPMTSADVKHVRQLHSKLLPLVTYPSSFFLQLLIMPGRHCLVAVDRAQPTIPIGFVSALVHNDRTEREELDYLVDQYLGRQSAATSSNDPSARKPRLEILTLGIEPDYQNCGLARKLVQEMVRRVQASLPKFGSALATGLAPPSPISPVTPATPEETRGAYFNFNKSDASQIITYANVATSNIPAINFYEKLGMYVVPGVRLDNVYRGQSQASRLLSNANMIRNTSESDGSSSGFTSRKIGMGNSRDAFVVAGLL
ncbi:hypothetical protein CC1G_02062 [Coprinopsis cinerea okayama7|uniref:N-alpha-acetyltransferase 60 n=1 Tax=Coprinopsis cinerea (strain Okayama-7 / 130 / ATCC MYA-4618 / FGSC 9003) TaxID=240176 RepID=A8N6F9_COPC7|nr:hypothetical protein CC1G_02062 [Coprinopsis cinerea okayama7\|eukprot:XP_001830426.2 hypothetical protein CC1G_02062 [Coprinopsis cinerea okayama7\